MLIKIKTVNLCLSQLGGPYINPILDDPQIFERHLVYFQDIVASGLNIEINILKIAPSAEVSNPS